MLQTANLLKTSACTPTFVPTTKKATRSSPRVVMAPDKISRAGDAKLWKLHDEFCLEHAKLSKLDTREASAGSNGNAPASAKRAFKRWEAQLSATDRVARRIAATRAFTLDGMLMKIQVAGSVFDWVGKSYAYRPYTAHENLWEANPRQYAPHSEEELLIVSLRDDLLRLHARCTDVRTRNKN